MANRIRLTKESGELRVDIGPKNYGMVYILAIVMFTEWFICFSAFLLITDKSIEDANVRGIFLGVVFIILGLAVGLYPLYFTLLNIVGNETITAKNGVLIVKRKILRLIRRREFEINKIYYLRASKEYLPKMFTLFPAYLDKFIGGTLSFEYKGETNRFGFEVPYDEAESIVQAILKIKKQHESKDSGAVPEH